MISRTRVFVFCNTLHARHALSASCPPFCAAPFSLFLGAPKRRLGLLFGTSTASFWQYSLFNMLLFGLFVNTSFLVLVLPTLHFFHSFLKLFPPSLSSLFTLSGSFGCSTLQFLTDRSLTLLFTVSRSLGCSTSRCFRERTLAYLSGSLRYSMSRSSPSGVRGAIRTGPRGAQERVRLGFYFSFCS